MTTCKRDDCNHRNVVKDGLCVAHWRAVATRQHYAKVKAKKEALEACLDKLPRGQPMTTKEVAAAVGTTDTQLVRRILKDRRDILLVGDRGHDGRRKEDLWARG